MGQLGHISGIGVSKEDRAQQHDQLSHLVVIVRERITTACAVRHDFALGKVVELLVAPGLPDPSVSTLLDLAHVQLAVRAVQLRQDAHPLLRHNPEWCFPR